MVVRREAWNALGGLDREYFMYGEDLDLGLRLWLAGRPVGLVPAARVTHSYDFDKGPGKWFWLERNRWRTVLSVYPTALLVLLAPALLATELGLLAVAARQGWLGAKLRAQAAVIGGLPRTLGRRRAVQRGRRIGAGELAAHLTSSLDSTYLAIADSLAEHAPGDLLAACPPRPWLCSRTDARRSRPALPRARGDRRARDLRPRTRAGHAQHDPELELVAFVNRDAGPRLAAELGERVSAVTLPVSAHSRAQWALGELALVPVAATRARVELLHAMANFAPLGELPSRGHDPRSPIPSCSPTCSQGQRARPRTRWSHSQRGGRTGSSRSPPPVPRRSSPGSASRARASTSFPNGVRPAPPAPSTVGVRERYELGQRRIVLTVATNLPHKNLPALIDALALIAPAERPLLAIAGHDTDEGRLQAGARAGVGEYVRLLGHCSTAELDALYALAACLVLPTLHEGFGLPAIEAMARSLPVACSDIPALREVGGSAALYFDPHSPAQISAASATLADTGPRGAAARAGACPRGPLQLGRGGRGDARGISPGDRRMSREPVARVSERVG